MNLFEIKLEIEIDSPNTEWIYQAIYEQLQDDEKILSFKYRQLENEEK